MLSAFPPQGSAKAEPPRELLLLPPRISPLPRFSFSCSLPAGAASVLRKQGGGFQLGLGFGGTTEVAAPGEGLGLFCRARER